MGVRGIRVAGKALVINELEDVCDAVTSRALTGSWLWDSALYLSEWMATQGGLHFNFHDKTVLELGAGAGLPGLMAALLGAGRVVLTDIGPLLPGLIKNVEANGLQDRVEVKEHVWGSEESPRKAEFEEFDLVLMSYVFFHIEEMQALAKTLKSVCRKGTVVWAATEVRPWTAEWLGVLASQGFGVVDQLPLQLGPSPFLDEESLAMFVVFRLTPPNENIHVA